MQQEERQQIINSMDNYVRIVNSLSNLYNLQEIEEEAINKLILFYIIVKKEFM